MTTGGERVKFLMTLQREADVSEGDGLAILRNAATLQRLAVERCNRELTPAEERRDAACETRIRDVCDPYGIRPCFDGDPRGVVVTLQLPNGYTNNFAGDGVSVPAPRH